MSAGYVVADTYLARLAESLTGTALPDPTGYTLHLFTNDVTIGDDIQDASGLTEGAWTAYAPAPLDVSTWGAAVVTAHVAVITAPIPIAFAIGAVAPLTRVYGYWVEDADGNFSWAESFAGGQPVAEGGTYKITPQFFQKTCR